MFQRLRASAHTWSLLLLPLLTEFSVSHSSLWCPRPSLASLSYPCPMTVAPPPQHSPGHGGRKVWVGHMCPTAHGASLGGPALSVSLFPTLIYIPTTRILNLCAEVLRPLRAIHLLWVGWQAHEKGCHLAWFPQMLTLARMCHISSAASERG